MQIISSLNCWIIAFVAIIVQKFTMSVKLATSIYFVKTHTMTNPIPGKFSYRRKLTFKEFHAFSDNFIATYNVNSNINSLWSSFKLKCLELLNKWVPSKNASIRFHQPWINTIPLKDFVVASNDTITLLAIPIWKMTGLDLKYTQQECKKAYNEYLSGIVSSSNRVNPKRLWSFIKSKHVDNCGVPALKLND